MSSGGYNHNSQQLYKETEVKEQGTNINKHRKKEGSWKVTAIAGGIIILFYVIVTLL